MIREMGCLIVFSSIVSQSTTNSGETWSAYSNAVPGAVRVGACSGPGPR